MFQGRVDYAFDVTQADNGYNRISGPKHLYIGQFGHTPSTFPGPDFAYVMAQGVAWFDHYLQGAPNGIDKSKPVTIAAAKGTKRTSYAGLPKTKVVGAGFRGTSLSPHGPEVPTGARDVRRLAAQGAGAQGRATTRGSSRPCSPATA